MRRIRLTIAYDGTNYVGWQIQPNGVSVEEVLNASLSKLLGENVQVIGASRTDSGVHADGNICVFDTESLIPADKFRFAANEFLPDDIKVQAS
ncbi:MAG: tRNA pseudouridine synthase A, partial [Lachnospiraceae bacterium]|nr:tRNA pseudouridine synthase A [Lachnospiraceae bacterium]